LFGASRGYSSTDLYATYLTAREGFSGSCGEGRHESENFAAFALANYPFEELLELCQRNAELEASQAEREQTELLNRRIRVC